MTTGAEAAKAEDTFPKLLLRNAVKFQGKPAMREKYLGIWQTWNWENVLDEVKAFSVGLSGLGIKAGDKVAIVGDNRPRLYWAICATPLARPAMTSLRAWIDAWRERTPTL